MMRHWMYVRGEKFHGYMMHTIYILSLLLILVGCAHKDTTMSHTIIKSAEEGIKYLERHPPSGDSLQLAISEPFTFAGKSDTMGAGMAVLLDKILGFGYATDGFEQKDGFRLYHYKKMQ